MNPPDVLVVGGGIIGSAVALEAALRDASVTVVERHMPGVGATGASAGMLAPQLESEGPGPAFRFGIRNREAWPELARRIEGLADWPVGFRRDGMLVANRTRAEDRTAREMVAWQTAEGCRAERIDSAAAREIHPEVSSKVRSYLWLPDEAQVDAQRLAVALGDALRAAGVRVLRGKRVTRLRRGEGVVRGVELEGDERIDAPRVVMAAGAWSARVEGLPRELPVRPVRGQILRLRPDRSPAGPLVADHRGHYLVPRENGSMLAGSTMEDAGFDDRTTEAGRTEEEWRAFRPDR